MVGFSCGAVQHLADGARQPMAQERLLEVGLLAAPEIAQPFAAVRRLRDAVAPVLKRIGESLSAMIVIFHDQDGAGG
jgi:hypothetical protein